MPNHSVEDPMVTGKMVFHLDARKLHPAASVSKVRCWSTRAAAKDLLAPTKATDGGWILHKDRVISDVDWRTYFSRA